MNQYITIMASGVGSGYWPASTEETTVMGVPCMTLRNSTERPETVTIGTNEIVGTNPENIVPYLRKLVTGDWKKGGIPNMWDGKTAGRNVEIIASI